MDKQQIRRTMRQQNRALTSEERREASERIFSRLTAEALGEGVRCVAAFCALADEPMTERWLAEWARQGLRMVVPRVEGDEMQFYDWSPQTQAAGAFGIDEPTPEAVRCAPSEIDLMVVPGVAFTPCGGRLGRGRGYYDRYLSQEGFRAFCVGVCFACQQRGDIPAEAHDKRVDAVISAK